MKIKIGSKKFELVKFTKESDFEKVIISIAEDIFGVKTIYLETKRKIKRKNSNLASIPDGYLLDFRDNLKLWVVENELSTHDSFKHIGVQLLKFATQFSDGSFLVKKILTEHIDKSNSIKEKFKKLIKKTQFKNISEALDFAIYENEYGFVIIIDEITDDLIRVTKEIARVPELIEVKKFISGNKEIYAFEEFLKDFEDSKASKIKEEKEIDTIVCPSKADGHRVAFLDQKTWYAVRISPSIKDKLKYLAMYEVSPISAIKWIGKIQKIEPFKDTGKYKIYCYEIFKIPPIKLGDRKYAPQSPRYTKFDLFAGAKKLSDIF